MKVIGTKHKMANAARCCFAAVAALSALVVVGHPARAQGGPVTTRTLLQEMCDRDALARLPRKEYVSHQASSYDRASTTPSAPATWFGNHDWSQFIRSEMNGGRREWVLMDADGPGCVTRIWFAGGAPPEDCHLRVYLDGAATPVIEGAPSDLMSGRGPIPSPLAISNPPDVDYQGGFNLFLPIPYARHCKITWDQVNHGDPSSPPDQRWYNIEYRTYAPNVRVQTLSLRGLHDDQGQIAQAARTLAAPPAPLGRTVSLFRHVAAGGQAALDLPGGPAAIRRLEMEVKTDDPAALDQALRSTVIAMAFDGEQTVWSPAGDFFGSGVGLNPLHGWDRDVTPDGRMVCRWTMPYAGAARITVTNLGGTNVDVALKAVTSPWTWDARSMHFHTNWRQQRDIPTRPYSDWNYVTAAGRGVYVGDTLSIYSPAPDWWGEGDEKVWVDGETFPSHFGTGTEDYYGYSWGNPALFQGPLSNQVRMDGPQYLGNTVLTRTRTLDAIPFTRSLKFDMEIWDWVDCKLRYAVATYWYALPGATSAPLPNVVEARQPIPITTPPTPKVIQSTGGTTEIQHESRWNTGQQLWWRDAKPGDTLSLWFSVSKAGHCEITLNNAYAHDYGIIQFSVDGTKIGAPVDFYSPDVEVKQNTLGALDLTTGRHVLKCEVVGANPLAEKRYMMGIEWVHADPAQ